MWGYYHGALGGMWLLGTAVFWLVVVGLVVWGIRTFVRTTRPPLDAAVLVLRRRLAAGEIGEAEYEKVKKILER